jgi:hypothetical protein
VREPCGSPGRGATIVPLQRGVSVQRPITIDAVAEKTLYIKADARVAYGLEMRVVR